jgi:hypothetical protein
VEKQSSKKSKMAAESDSCYDLSNYYSAKAMKNTQTHEKQSPKKHKLKAPAHKKVKKPKTNS